MVHYQKFHIRWEWKLPNGCARCWSERHLGRIIFDAFCVSTSVTRLGDFWKFVQFFCCKTKRNVYLLFRPCWKTEHSSKKYFGDCLGNFCYNLGYFLSHHLVTLVSTSCPKRFARKVVKNILMQTHERLFFLLKIRSLSRPSTCALPTSSVTRLGDILLFGRLLGNYFWIMKPEIKYDFVKFWKWHWVLQFRALWLQ